MLYIFFNSSLFILQCYSQSNRSTKQNPLPECLNIQCMTCVFEVHVSHNSSSQLFFFPIALFFNAKHPQITTLFWVVKVLHWVKWERENITGYTALRYPTLYLHWGFFVRSHGHFESKSPACLHCPCFSSHYGVVSEFFQMNLDWNMHPNITPNTLQTPAGDQPMGPNESKCEIKSPDMPPIWQQGSNSFALQVNPLGVLYHWCS